MAARTRIAVAERWSVLRRGLVDVLAARHDIVADIEDPALLAPAVARQGVDLAVVGDDRSSDLPTLVAVLGSPAVGVPVVVLCDEIDSGELRTVLRTGAAGVLSKKIDDAGLLDAVQRAMRGERVIDQRFLPLLFRDDLDARAPESGGLLTARELEVLAQLARGASNREIAAALVVGESTVKTHLGRMYAKLEVSSRHQAVGRAFELGLLSARA
jgi:DNA-binding NarL/FixJ family response regulator